MQLKAWFSFGCLAGMVHFHFFNSLRVFVLKTMAGA